MAEKPSKSARKREHLELQNLGVQLIELPEAKLRNIPLGDDLLNAILVAKRISSNSALRRQRQLIGKLMSRVDNAEAIRSEFARATQAGREQKALFRDVEQWRDRLVQEGVEGYRAFVAASRIDDTELLALVKSLGRCTDDAAKRRVAKQIFRRLHTLIEEGMQPDSA
ncbi:MAG: ribosome biogenesis factor YjgA [Pseudomonadota bacterium]